MRHQYSTGLPVIYKLYSDFETFIFRYALDRYPSCLSPDFHVSTNSVHTCVPSRECLDALLFPCERRIMFAVYDTPNRLLISMHNFLANSGRCSS